MCHEAKAIPSIHLKGWNCGQLLIEPAAATWKANIATTPVIIPRIVTVSMTIRECAPDCHHDGRDDNRCQKRHAVDRRLVRNMNAQYANHQKNGDKPDDDRAHQPKRCAPPRQYLAQHAYNSRDN